MGIKKTVQYFCDIKDCGKEMFGASEVNYQVIFTTEQTEGRSVSPYLESNKLYVCGDCLQFLLKGNYIFAHGAQGCNTYYFKNN